MIWRSLGLLAAVLVVAVGVIWTFQGLGYIEGSFMTGNRTWAVVGPIVAGFGVAMVIVVVQRSRDRR